MSIAYRLAYRAGLRAVPALLALADGIQGLAGAIDQRIPLPAVDELTDPDPNDPALYAWTTLVEGP